MLRFERNAFGGKSLPIGQCRSKIRLQGSVQSDLDLHSPQQVVESWSTMLGLINIEIHIISSKILVLTFSLSLDFFQVY